MGHTFYTSFPMTSLPTNYVHDVEKMVPSFFQNTQKINGELKFSQDFVRTKPIGANAIPLIGNI
jgi:hypothetical protein